jgi:hypothetical protein
LRPITKCFPYALIVDKALGPNFEIARKRGRPDRFDVHPDSHPECGRI